MLSKKKQFTYNINTGEIQCDFPITFIEEDTKAILQLRGELDGTVKTVLNIKPPTEDKLIPVTGVDVPYKSIAREFTVVTSSPGVYKCQLVLTVGQDVNKSIVFQYEVQPSLK